eukprot:TRINITY_DN7244_c1_g3_i3.p1 TRINITY_DN7244_c1_g3~~TRINITY_DN7244_c1_g3_i3.p1  ORF type:complete len:452 (-),score=18.36 TRINITY_DN7244_c1_g3_i3:481-1809(-)
MSDYDDISTKDLYSKQTSTRYNPWTPQEDEILKKLVKKYGARNWSKIAGQIPSRTGKSCRLRWVNQLQDNIRKGPFTPEEDQIIVQAHKQFGNKWTQIALCLPGRTDNAIKNRWNSSLSKRLQVERSTKAKVNKSFDDTDLPLQKLSGLSSESLQLHAHKQQQLLQDEDFQYPSRQRCINAIEQEQQRKEAGNKYDVMNNFLNNSNPEYFPQLPDRNAIDNRNPLPMLTNRYSSQQQYNYDQEIKHNDSQSIDRLHDSDCLLHTQGPNFAPVVQLRKQHDMGLQFKSEYVDMHNRNMIGGRSIPISSQLIQSHVRSLTSFVIDICEVGREPVYEGIIPKWILRLLFKTKNKLQNEHPRVVAELAKKQCNQLEALTNKGSVNRPTNAAKQVQLLANINFSINTNCFKRIIPFEVDIINPFRVAITLCRFTDLLVNRFCNPAQV